MPTCQTEGGPASAKNMFSIITNAILKNQNQRAQPKGKNIWLASQDRFYLISDLSNLPDPI
jgi:hypothetical protein